MKFILCEVESEFIPERDRSFCKVSKPIQAFNSQAEADEILELFNPFYDFSLRVVESDKLDVMFR